ncbi:amino acid adenylation domain-containing protein [Chitinophaga dinghuensis]|uniref:Amino acid adenylation domain-containing protein n=1 Tax=Chitinophaga dinghuensis TaxID=1539050 RepID=A0A327VS86_9BACT|nr:non-ribosomal peptide synthetase [Chitinophaga dinghuensis]RAJ76808.1 amino acid adenylation domain-containing protein [Chitinophaga dinghuensis]
MEIVSVIKAIREKGIAIRLVEGQLEVDIPVAHRNEETISLLKNNKPEIVAYLQAIAGKEKYTPIPRIPDAAYYPVSGAQLRLWLESQQEEASRAYYTGFQMLLPDVTPDILEKTIDDIVGRHEVLRTVFVSDEQQDIFQRVVSANDFKVTLRTVDCTSANNLQEEVKALIREDAQLLFDLEQGPLFRVIIFQLPENRLLLHWAMHHIISDAWSLPILQQEIAAILQAYQAGTTSGLQPLRIQYRDYTAWALQQLENGQLAAQQQYWLQQLHGELPVLAFPLKGVRPPVKTYQGETITTHISEQVGRMMTQYALSHNSTLFTVVLASLHIILNKYTGANDIIIGSPFAAREHPDLKEQIGFYTNTVALRNEMKDTDTFHTFFSQVKQTVEAAHQHQQYPFEEVVKALRLKKDASRNPVFDVMLVVLPDNHPAPSTSNNYELTEHTGSKFDLLISVSGNKGPLTLSAEYNTDLYDRQLILQFLQHFQQLLEAVFSQPGIPLAGIGYLSAADYAFTAGEVKPAYVTESVISLMESQVEKTPDDIALVFKEESLTYRQLNDQTNQLADYLRKVHGAKPGVNIGVLLERSHLSALAMIAIIKSGACYVPVDHKYQKDRIRYIMEDADLALVLGSKDIVEESILEGIEFIDLEGFNYSDWSSQHLVLTNQPSDAAFLIYTSGSTGKPKGVLQTHSMLNNLIHWNINESGVDAGLRFLQYNSFSFDVSVQDCWFVFSSGGTIYITPEEMKADFESLSDYIIKNSIETLCFPFSALSNFFDKLEPSFIEQQQIKHILCAGEQLTVNKTLENFLHQYPSLRLHNHYGPSETHVVTSYTMSAALQNYRAYVPIGKPLPNTDVYLLDSHRQPVPLYVTGEVYIGGANVAAGYQHLPELTSERFRQLPWSDTVTYKTGDLAYLAKDGNLVYLGRNDNQVKIRGYRIELGEIKSHLLGSDSILQAHVDVVMKNGEKQLVAYVVPDGNVTATDIRRKLASVLPDYMVPAHVVIMETLPVTLNGKIDKTALPDISQYAALHTAYVAPETPVEKRLAELWMQVLALDKVGTTDNFFELGGHSLSMYKMLNLVKKEYSIDFRLDLFITDPCISVFALHIEQLLTQQLQPQVSVNQKKILI